MLEKTEGIVLKSIPYRESSNIVQIYTKDWGLKSFIIKGGRKKNATIHSSLFQPMQLLNIVAYVNNKSNLSQLKEVSILENLNNIYCNIIKSSLVFFITEVIILSLREEMKDENIYSFLYDSIIDLNNKTDKEMKDFHLFFLYEFAKILGFEPNNLSPFTSSKQERNDRLSLFLEFYKEHITNHKQIQSQEILHLINN